MPTNPPSVDGLPTAPDPSDRPTFSARAKAWAAGLVPFRTQLLALAANVFNNATEAAASALTAVNAPGTSATSTTALTIGTGSKTLTVQVDKAFAVGQFVVVANTAAAGNFMLGQITAFNSGTGSMTVNVAATGGSGTFAAWTVSLTLAPTVYGLSGVQQAGLRNKIHNGDMRVAQRGTSIPVTVAGVTTLDRWVIGSVGSAINATVTQSTNVPAAAKFKASMLVTVGAVDVPAAGTVKHVTQHIEGYSVVDLVGQSFAVGFWAISSKTGIHSVNLRSTGGDRTFVSAIYIAAANTWQWFTVAVPGGLPTAGTWDFSNSRGLSLGFCMSSGSTYVAPAADSWQAGNYLAAAGQVNVFDTVGNIFGITGVQLEPGLVSTPFEFRPYGLELALCRRYARVCAVQVGAAAAPTCMPIDMRATPTITGGGAGFVSTNTTADTLICSQTTTAVQTLTLAADL